MNKKETKGPLEEFIEPAKLEFGTIIYLETNARVYELEILGDNRAIVSGGKGFLGKKPCTIIGSVDIGPIFAGKILRNHHLIISTPKRRYTTGLIKSASITNGKWRYDLWKDK